jgi:hypothetical protein
MTEHQGSNFSILSLCNNRLGHEDDRCSHI